MLCIKLATFPVCPVNSGDDVSSPQSRDSQGTMPGPEERKVELLGKVCSACLVSGRSHGGGRGGETAALLELKTLIHDFGSR